MDLVTLFQQIPPLLYASIGDHTNFDSDVDSDVGGNRNNSSLRALRLVNEELSRVAPLGVRCYTLLFKGPYEESKDTHLGSAALLRHTRLECLKVNLLRSSKHSPALDLEELLREVGDALILVTKLMLTFIDTAPGVRHPGNLMQALSTLAKALPSLISLTSCGKLPTELLSTLGEACPRLTMLTLKGMQWKLPQLKEFLVLQPTLLPRISSLHLSTMYGEIPDMSQNTSILSLELSFFEFKQTHWSMLPRKLRSLICGRSVTATPICTTGKEILASLVRIEFGSMKLDLDELDQLFSKGGFPGQISTSRFGITCSVTRSTAAHLVSLNQQIEAGRIHPSTFEICSCEGATNDWLMPFHSTQLSVRGITSVSLDCKHANVLPMLRAFPDIKSVSIMDCDALTDMELDTLSASKHLTSVTLENCKSVTPMGVLALCQHLPGLLAFCFCSCELLKGPAMLLCKQQLTEHFLHVAIEDLDDFDDFDD